MHSVFIRCSCGAKDLASVLLWEAGATGVIERDLPGGEVELQAFFHERVDLPESLGADAHWQEEAAVDWMQVFHDQWEPFPVGERFYLVPEWRSDPAPEGRLRLTIRPGLACGTGWHPATQLSLMALERHMSAGDTVLDLGVGSGILSEAAALLGARRVVACDIDAEAAAIAARNLKGLPVALFVGSVRSLKDRAVDFTVANLNAETIVSLAGEIARVTGRRAAVTGFRERDQERVRAAALRHFEVAEVSEMDGWVLLVLHRR